MDLFSYIKQKPFAILLAISMAADKLYVQLSSGDEVGNSFIDLDLIDEKGVNLVLQLQ